MSEAHNHQFNSVRLRKLPFDWEWHQSGFGVDGTAVDHHWSNEMSPDGEESVNSYLGVGSGNRRQLLSAHNWLYKEDLSGNCVEPLLRTTIVEGKEDRVERSDLISTHHWTNPSWQSDQNSFVQPTRDDRLPADNLSHPVVEWTDGRGISRLRRRPFECEKRPRLRGLWRSESYAKAVGSVGYGDDLEEPTTSGIVAEEMPIVYGGCDTLGGRLDLGGVDECMAEYQRNRTVIIVPGPMESFTPTRECHSTAIGRYRKKINSVAVGRRGTKGFARRKLQAVSTPQLMTVGNSKRSTVDITVGGEREKDQRWEAKSAEIYGRTSGFTPSTTCLSAGSYCVSGRSLPNCLAVGAAAEDKRDSRVPSARHGDSVVHIVVDDGCETTSVLKNNISGSQSSGTGVVKTVGGVGLSDSSTSRSVGGGDQSAAGDNFAAGDVGRSASVRHSVDKLVALRRNNCGEERLTADRSVVKEKRNASVTQTLTHSHFDVSGGGMSATVGGVVKSHFNDQRIEPPCQGCWDCVDRSDCRPQLICSSTKRGLEVENKMPLKVDISLSSRNSSTVWVQSSRDPFGYHSDLLETPMFATRNDRCGRRRLFSTPTAVRTDLSGSGVANGVSVDSNGSDQVTIITHSSTIRPSVATAAAATTDPTILWSRSRDSIDCVTTGASKAEEANLGSNECPLRDEPEWSDGDKHAKLTQFVSDAVVNPKICVEQRKEEQLDASIPPAADTGCQLKLNDLPMANIGAEDNTDVPLATDNNSADGADEPTTVGRTKGRRVDSAGMIRTRTTSPLKSNRSEVTELNGPAIYSPTPALVSGNRADPILSPCSSSRATQPVATVTTATSPASSLIAPAATLTAGADVVVTTESETIRLSRATGNLTPSKDNEVEKLMMMTSSTTAASSTDAVRMDFSADVLTTASSEDEFLMGDGSGIVCVAGAAGSRSPLCGVPTFLLNSTPTCAVVEMLNSSAGSADSFEAVDTLVVPLGVGARRDLSGKDLQYNKRGSLVEALDNPRSSTDSSGLSLLLQSDPIEMDEEGVILRYKSVPSHCRNRNGRDFAADPTSLVRPSSAVLLDYEGFSCYDALGQMPPGVSGLPVSQTTDMTGSARELPDENHYKLLPPKGLNRTAFSRIYQKLLTSNRAKTTAEVDRPSHSGRTSPLRSITAPIGRMFGHSSGAIAKLLMPDETSSTADSGEVKDLRKIRRSNTFSSLAPVKCKRMDFVEETAAMLGVVANSQQRPLRRLSKSSGTGSVEKLSTDNNSQKTSSASDSSVQRYLDSVYGGGAVHQQRKITRNLSVQETQLLLSGEEEAVRSGSKSQSVRVGRVFNPLSLPNRRRMPTTLQSNKTSTVEVNECVNPLLVHNYSAERKVTGVVPTLDLPARLTRDRNRKKIPAALPHNKSQIRRAQSQPLHINKAKSSLAESASKGDVFDDGGNDDGISSSDDISDAEFNADHSPRSATTPDNRNSIYSTTSSVTASSFNSENVESSGASCETDVNPPLMAEAIWDHVSMVPDELAFSVGNVIEVMELRDSSDVWYGYHGERFGWFPASYVRLLANQDSPNLSLSDRLQPIDDVHSELDSVASTSQVNVEKLNQTRANVVREVICTERDYVKLLEHLVDGFLRQAQRRSDMFTQEKLSTIFGNLEEIYEFHRKFLTDLENCIQWDNLPASRIGDCFIQHESTFDIYSHYCNNQPQSVSELSGLYQQTKFRHFFEACRLLRDMTELSLDGFLLTPVQRICKYPLQLGELVKCTTPDHPDSKACRNALDAMKRVATVINDKKRRIESLQKLAVWQTSIDGWQGPDVLRSSCSLIGCGEVTLRCSNSASTSFKDVTLFLFDHLVVFCRKDLLKRNQLVYKDRLYLKDTRIIDVQDGKDPQFGVNVKYGVKLHCDQTQLSFLILLKSKKQKAQWIKVLQDERSFVAEGKNLPPSEDEIRVALTAAGCQSIENDSKRNPKNFKKLPDLVLIPTDPKGGGQRSKKWSGLFSQTNNSTANRRLKV